MRGDVTGFKGAQNGAPWVEPALASVWENFPNEEKFGFRVFNGMTFIKGVVRGATGGGPAGSAWVFLPAGARPYFSTTNTNNVVQFAVMTNSGMQTLQIRRDGAMFFPTFAVGAGGYALLSCIPPFPADS